ncbi:hypothetical protein [Pseudomonas rustica]|jgi:hypothetical protein|uniref:hypothetical protein n=1 Tax=Pseudomonas rustica TaxID=2827099 RepID=UPI001BAF0A04|nr:hypothetical protein [Pseudomonas rustica]MBS4090679.1 hypothetical protein [Pseudomonas rustica]
MSNTAANSKFSIIFPVACTLIGVFATSTFTWLTSYQAASQNERSACIQRIDTQEKLLREKGENFLSAMGDMLNYSVFPKNATAQELAKNAGPLIKAGIVMVAYAPPELGLRSMMISNSVRLGSLASMHKFDQDAAIGTIDDSFGKWPAAFYDALEALDKQRQKCE